MEYKKWTVQYDDNGFYFIESDCKVIMTTRGESQEEEDFFKKIVSMQNALVDIVGMCDDLQYPSTIYSYSDVDEKAKHSLNEQPI